MIKKLKSKKLFVIMLVLLGVFVLGNIIYMGYMYYPNFRFKNIGDYGGISYAPHTNYENMSKCRHNVYWRNIDTEEMKMGNLYIFDISCEDEDEAGKLEKRLLFRSIIATKHDSSVSVVTTPRVLQHAWIFNPFKEYKILAY